MISQKFKFAAAVVAISLAAFVQAQTPIDIGSAQTLTLTNGTTLSGTVTGVSSSTGQIVMSSQAAGLTGTITLAPTATPGIFTVVQSNIAGIVVGSSATAAAGTLTAVSIATGGAVAGSTIAAGAAAAGAAAAAGGSGSSSGSSGTR